MTQFSDVRESHFGRGSSFASFLDGHAVWVRASTGSSIAASTCEEGDTLEINLFGRIRTGDQVAPSSFLRVAQKKVLFPRGIDRFGHAGDDHVCLIKRPFSRNRIDRTEPGAGVSSASALGLLRRWVDKSRFRPGFPIAGSSGRPSQSRFFSWARGARSET